VDDDDETRYIEHMGTGPVLQKDIPEIIRAIRHAIVNQHVAVRYVSEVAKSGEGLAKKALDHIDATNERIDDITGKTGQRHIDGGGALGRMQDTMDHIEKLINKGVWAIIGGAIAVGGAVIADVIVHLVVK
jgi:hypothetical protein